MALNTVPFHVPVDVPLKWCIELHFRGALFILLSTFLHTYWHVMAWLIRGPLFSIDENECSNELTVDRTFDQLSKFTRKFDRTLDVSFDRMFD